MKNNSNNSEMLKRYLFTVSEYNTLISELVSTPQSNISEFSIDKIKLMILRKYEVPNEPLYLINVIEAIKESNLFDEFWVESIEKRFLLLENDKTELLLSNGETINLREANEAILYGVLLHADLDKCERILNTDIENYSYLVHKYVEALDCIVIEIYQEITKVNIEPFSRNKVDRASVIFLGDDASQNKLQDSNSYWANLRGKHATDDEIFEIFQSLSDEEKTILYLVADFLQKLQNPDCNIEELESCVLPQTKVAWGDFSKAREYVDNIKIGHSMKVRYHEKGDMAYVRCFKHFDERIIINQPQMSTDIFSVTLVKDKSKGWLIYSIGSEPDYHFMEGSLKDFCKYLLKQLRKD